MFDSYDERVMVTEILGIMTGDFMLEFGQYKNGNDRLSLIRYDHVDYDDEEETYRTNMNDISVYTPQKLEPDIIPLNTDIDYIINIVKDYGLAENTNKTIKIKNKDYPLYRLNEQNVMNHTDY